MEWLFALRLSLIEAFRYFPIFLISIVGFLAAALGNLGLALLFVGHATVVPLATTIFQFIFSRILPEASKAAPGAADLTTLIPSGDSSSSATLMPTSWMNHTLFFFGYMLANGVSLFTMQSDSDSKPYLVENRKAKAITVMAMSLVSAAVIILLRYKMTSGAETLPGIFTALVVGGGLGYGWYQLAAACGIRHADIMGVVQSIVPPQKEARPLGCVYSPIEGMS
jgi:hypothetical protein